MPSGMLAVSGVLHFRLPMAYGTGIINTLIYAMAAKDVPVRESAPATLEIELAFRCIDMFTWAGTLHCYLQVSFAEKQFYAVLVCLPASRSGRDSPGRCGGLAPSPRAARKITAYA